MIQLLKKLSANYPNVISKIDAGELLKNWEMAFGEYNAEDIYMAARYHMDVSPYFPSIADIKKAIVKGKMIYGNSSINTRQRNIAAPKAPNKKIEIYCKGSSACPYFDMDLCEGTEEEFNKCEF